MHHGEDGFNIYQLAEELNIPERKIMDFAAPVNPLGVSGKVKAEVRRHLKYLHRHPDTDTRRIRKRLGLYHDIDPETILCGNGSTELIHLIAKAIKPQKVLMPAPTFSGYEMACRMNSSPVFSYCRLRREDNFDLDPDAFIHEIERKIPAMAFLCNPNNPTGRLLEKQAMKKIADAAKEYGCFLVVDEAYLDFSAGDSMVDETPANSCLFVLKSMSHYYALAGVRFGYGIFPVEFIERLKAFKEPWTVNNLAQISAAAALKDKAYRKESLAVMRCEKAFLEKNFNKLGIAFCPADANFYLAETAFAPEIFRRLRTRGIVIRECSDFRGLDSSYLRIAVKSHRENAVLVRELSRIVFGKG